jgi:hypothetical protein
VPRLLGLEATAHYLGVSIWTVCDLEASGQLPRVQVPGVRRLLFDRESLDQRIATWGAPVGPDAEGAAL